MISGKCQANGLSVRASARLWQGSPKRLAPRRLARGFGPHFVGLDSVAWQQVVTPDFQISFRRILVTSADRRGADAERVKRVSPRSRCRRGVRRSVFTKNVTAGAGIMGLVFSLSRTLGPPEDGHYVADT
jgi:hypothetical protein